jgi:hypothetical protein
MRRASGSGRSVRVALALLGAALLVLVLAQVLLPWIAARRISSRLRRYGTVESVSVTAWPAVKLLWAHADSVRVKAGTLRVTPAETAKLLWEGRGAGKVEMTAAHAQEGSLWLSDVALRKRGTMLGASARASVADVQAALPEGLAVELLGSGRGSVEVRASGALFGVGASVEAVAGASQGRLVAHPVGFPLEGLRLTLFADPHVKITGVAASRTVGPRGEPAYRLGITASLR